MEILEIMNKLRNKYKQKNIFKGDNNRDLLLEAAMLQIGCLDNKVDIENIQVNSKAVKMLKEIMKKLKVKSVNDKNGKPNIKIDIEFIKNKKYYCKKYF